MNDPIYDRSEPPFGCLALLIGALAASIFPLLILVFIASLRVP